VAELLHDHYSAVATSSTGPMPTSMNSETKPTLSNNNLRRMQGWARAVDPADWQDRCAVLSEYLA